MSKMQRMQLERMQLGRWAGEAGGRAFRVMWYSSALETPSRSTQRDWLRK